MEWNARDPDACVCGFCGDGLGGVRVGNRQTTPGDTADASANILRIQSDRWHDGRRPPVTLGRVRMSRDFTFARWMRQLRIALATAFVLLMSMAFPAAVIASDGDSPGLMRSGIAAVARMSDDATRSGGTAALAQQSKRNNNWKTTIIVASVVAVATVILYEIHLHTFRVGLPGADGR